jgi:hypothetical protein
MKTILHVCSRIAGLLLHYGLVLAHAAQTDFYNKAIQKHSQFKGKVVPKAPQLH